MPDSTFTPGPTPNTVRAADGKVLTVPERWVLVPPGDAALTRRSKAAGDHWVVAEKRGRKVFSRGIWVAKATVERIRADLEAERSTEGFSKKKEADARRREKAHVEYVEDFHGAVVAFLAFHAAHAEKRRVLEIVFLNFVLEDVTLVPETRKPFDMLAEGLLVHSSRGDKIWTRDFLVPN